MRNRKRIALFLGALCVHVMLSGCGGGGSDQGAQNAGVTTPSSSLAEAGAPAFDNTHNYYSLADDTYGLQNATFLAATRSDSTIVLRAALATGLTDPNFSTVFRIDLLQPAQVSSFGTYAIGSSGANLPAFPGEIIFFNGHKSTLLNTTAGTITFTSYGRNSGDLIAGSFSVQVEDDNFAGVPRPSYLVKGEFSFVLDASGAIVPTPSPVPAAAAGIYDAKCAGCHALGSYDGSANGAPDLALKGGEIAGKFTAGQPGHDGIVLSASEMRDLQILLNAN